MKHRSLQWLSLRSAIEPVQKLLYRFCLAIALATIALNPSLCLLPVPDAQAGSTGLVEANKPTELAGKPITTTQLPPSVASRLRKALSKQTKMPAAKLKLVEAAPKNWTNGCFGLARSGEICTQALLKGWRVTFASDGQRWIYRTDQQGRIYRLEP